MKNARETVKGIAGSHYSSLQLRRQAGEKTQDKNWRLSGSRSIAFHLLMSQGWMRAIAFSVLVTVLGMTGTTPNAIADELPDQPPEQPNLGVGNDAGEHGEAARSLQGEFGEELLASNLSPLLTASSQAPISTPSFGTANSNLELRKELPDTYSEEVPFLATDTSVAQSQAGDTQETDKPESVENAGQDNPGEIEHNSTSTPSPSTAGNAEVLPTATPEKVAQDNASPTQTPLTLAPGEVRILTPQTGVVSKNSTNLVVQYNAQSQIQVTVNQKPLDPST
ncbi:MAG TPA: hypothetical protein V6D50_26270, partial [Chroococcales cyanobacterium]